MTATPSEILVVNAGSSSLKFATFANEPAGTRLLAGLIARLGSSESTLSVQGPGVAGAHAPMHGSSAQDLAALIAREVASRGIIAIGHRIVHGGSKFSSPMRITPELIAELRALCPVDPAHLPAEIALIEALGQRFPALPQFACFDTCFHRSLPRVAQLLPLPRRLFEKGVRRYGFHGLSYEFVMSELHRRSNDTRAYSRVVLAHLGSGASLAAVLDGRCIDTTMAYTPNSGIPMGTRSGDLDAGLASQVCRIEGLDLDGFERMTTRESGLSGISETSADVRDLLERRARDERAADAIDVFCYQVKKAIGALTAALGGLDAIAFSGGIGENAPAIRGQICSGLGVFGVVLDERLNTQNANVISSDDSRVAVHVVKTDEEAVIAEATRTLLKETQ